MSIYLSDYYTALGDIFPTISTIDPNVAYRAINKARRTMCRTTDAGLYVYSLPLVAGTPNYAMPTIVSGGKNVATIFAITEVAIYMGNVRYTIPRVRVNQIPLQLFQSWPDRYYLKDGSLYYYPVPSSAFSSEWIVRKDPLDLDVAQTIPEAVIPGIYQDAVPFKAALQLAINDGNAEMIKHYEELYRLEMMQIPKQEI